MNFISGFPTLLNCDDPETITVEVEPNEGVAAVRYSLDGATWGGGTFVVSGQSSPSPGNTPPFLPRRVLIVGVLYSGDSGGEATITVTGSGGGQPSVVPVRQRAGSANRDPEASDIVAFSFYVF